MKILSYREFNAIYQNVVDDVYARWTPRLQEEIASHCSGWKHGQFDFRQYLRASALRYFIAYQTMAKRGVLHSVCDVGGFWGVFPLTLNMLGYAVTMTETLGYYSEAFKHSLFDYIANKGVRVLDYDPFQPGSPLAGSHTAVTVMAVLEHYPHSLRPFMENVTAGLVTRGHLYVEVPNIAYWPKRVSFLLGRTPLVPVGEVYRSETPFTGHHHEFTLAELHDLARVAGMIIVEEHAYNYSLRGDSIRPLQAVMSALVPSTRECLAMLCQKQG